MTYAAKSAGDHLYDIEGEGTEGVAALGDE